MSDLNKKEIDTILRTLDHENGYEINKIYPNGETVLFFACRQHNSRLVKDLLAEGADIHFKNSKSETVLDLMVRAKNYEICKILRKYGANPFAKPNGNFCALHTAFHKKDVTMIKILIDGLSRDELNNQLIGEQTILKIACFTWDAKIVELIISCGADPNIKSKGNYVINSIIDFDLPDIEAMVIMLIGAGAVLNIPNSSGFTPLITLSYSFALTRYRTAMILRNAGASPIIRDRMGVHSLDIAIERQDLAMIEILIEGLSASDLNNQNPDGVTPLMKACSLGNEKMVELLIERGASPIIRDKKGIHSLDIAIQKQYITIIEILAKKLSGNDINDGSGGFTPMMLACHAGKIQIARLLYKYGADSNTQNSRGDTPLMYACLSKNIQLIKWLLRNDADISIKNTDGDDAVSISKKSKLDEIVKILVPEESNSNQSYDNETCFDDFSVESKDGELILTNKNNLTINLVDNRTNKNNQNGIIISRKNGLLHITSGVSCAYGYRWANIIVS